MPSISEPGLGKVEPAATTPVLNRPGHAGDLVGAGATEAAPSVGVLVAQLNPELPGGTSAVESALDRLTPADRSAVAVELAARISDNGLLSLARDAHSQHVIDRLYAELVGGRVTAEEQRQAGRLLKARQAGNSERFPAITVPGEPSSPSDTALSARLTFDDHILVRLPGPSVRAAAGERRAVGGTELLVSPAAIVLVEASQPGEPTAKTIALGLLDLAARAQERVTVTAMTSSGWTVAPASGASAGAVPLLSRAGLAGERIAETITLSGDDLIVATNQPDFDCGDVHDMLHALWRGADDARAALFHRALLAAESGRIEVRHAQGTADAVGVGVPPGPSPAPTGNAGSPGMPSPTPAAAATVAADVAQAAARLAFTFREQGTTALRGAWEDLPAPALPAVTAETIRRLGDFDLARLARAPDGPPLVRQMQAALASSPEPANVTAFLRLLTAEYPWPGARDREYLDALAADAERRERLGQRLCWDGEGNLMTMADYERRRASAQFTEGLEIMRSSALGSALFLAARGCGASEQEAMNWARLGQLTGSLAAGAKEVLHSRATVRQLAKTMAPVAAQAEIAPLRARPREGRSEVEPIRVVGNEKVIESIRAYTAPLGQTEALRRVWTEASAGRAATRDGFNSSVRAFWTRVNAGEGPDATAIGQILRTAGFRLSSGSSAPLLELRIPGPSGDQIHAIADPAVRARLEASAARAAARPQGTEQLLRTYVQLSIDHVEPYSLNRARTLDPDNLRFMISWDNSVRGSRPDDPRRPR